MVPLGCRSENGVAIGDGQSHRKWHQYPAIPARIKPYRSDQRRVTVGVALLQSRPAAKMGISPSNQQPSIADVQPRTFWGHLRLESPRETLLYFASLALVAATVFIPRLPPLADYPQHLAVADVARRLIDPAAPEHALYSVSFFTYNGLFHFVVSRLGVVLPIEFAGRLVVAIALVGMGSAVLALLRSLGRPPVYAFLFVPALFSFSVAWGFINHSLCLFLGTTALVCIVHALVRPSIKLAIVTAVLGLVCAFAHVFATGVLCLLATAIAPELAWRHVSGARRAVRWRRAALRVVVALAPLLIGGIYDISVFLEQYDWNPDSYTDPALEGMSPPCWKKVVFFGTYVTGALWDKTDMVLVWLVVAVLVAIVIAGRQQRRRGEAPSGPAPVYGPLVALTVAYFVVPMVFIGTHLVFPRLAQVLLLTAIMVVPRLAGAVANQARRWAVGLALATGLNLCGHAVGHAIETNSASRVIDALPAGRRVSSVMYNAGGISFQLTSLVHVAAYYGTRQHGEWAYSFARFFSVPIHFDTPQPPWPKKGWEFRPRDYNARCNYARVYDVVVVGMPRRQKHASEEEVRSFIFKQDASIPSLIAHEGRFWAFDTAGIPADGTY